MTIPQMFCRYHEYDVEMEHEGDGVYVCPVCEAEAVLSHDPVWSTDGVSYRVDWYSSPVRLEDVT